MKRYGLLLVLITVTTLTSTAHALDFFDWATGSDVEIQQGSQLYEGGEVEYYDYQTGQYRYGTVEDMYGGEMTITDDETGEQRSLDMSGY